MNRYVNILIYRGLLLGFIILVGFLFAPTKPDAMPIISYMEPAERMTIFLIDERGLVVQTSMMIENREKDVEKRAEIVVESLIIGGKHENKIPSGFKPIIPNDTEVISTKYQDGIVKVNFSKDVLEVKKEYEEKMIEAIIYSLTSIPEVKGVIIYIEGELLTKLPSGTKELPTFLTRDYGINKVYELTSRANIQRINLYYVTKVNNEKHFVPVTKYINSTDSKINIIIRELTISAPLKMLNLVKGDVELIDYEMDENVLSLVFNDAILVKNKISPVFKESINLSIADSFELSKINYVINDKTIASKVFEENTGKYLVK